MMVFFISDGELRQKFLLLFWSQSTNTLNERCISLHTLQRTSRSTDRWPEAMTVTPVGMYVTKYNAPYPILLNLFSKGFIYLPDMAAIRGQNFVACIAVVSVSFKPSGASTKDARGHWAKRSKKVGTGGGGGGEGGRGRKGNACR